MEISYSALSNITGLIVMLSAYFFIGHRQKASGKPATRTIEFMRKFFLFFGLFYLPITLPFIFLYTHTDQFPLAMAIGFLGHALLFIAYIYASRMTFSLIPQLANKDRWVVLVGSAVCVLGTAAILFTMVLGTHPSYDYGAHIVNYKEAPPVSGTIALGAIIAWVPAGILFIYNAIRSRGSQRMRSILLGVGFLTLTAVGPLHGLARNWQTFMVADLATIVSIIMIGGGVAYKISHSLTDSTPPASPSTPAI